MAGSGGWIALEMQTQWSLLGLSNFSLLFLHIEKVAVWPLNQDAAFHLVPLRLAHEWYLYLHSGDWVSRQFLPLAWSSPARSHQYVVRNLPLTPRGSSWIHQAVPRWTPVSSSQSLSGKETQLLLPTPVSQANAPHTMDGGGVHVHLLAVHLTCHKNDF